MNYTPISYGVSLTNDF